MKKPWIVQHFLLPTLDPPLHCQLLAFLETLWESEHKTLIGRNLFWAALVMKVETQQDIPKHIQNDGIGSEARSYDTFSFSCKNIR